MLKKMQKNEKLFWLIILVIYGFFFTTMIYADFAVTFEHGVILCESLFSGNFFDFYDLACDGIYQNPAVYDIGLYIIWGIWCIPVYIVTRFWHVNAAETPVLMLYGKILVVIFHFLSAWVVNGIAQNLKLDERKRKLLLFIYVSSLCMIVPTIGNGQFDIIPTFFILLAVYMYTKDDYNKFLLVMTFAVSFKIFAVFILIPLILLREKRILYILRDIIISFIGTLFFKLLFWGRQKDYYDTLYFYSPDQYTTGWVERMFKIQFPGGLGDISLFVLCFALICGLAYFIRKDEDKIKERAIACCFFSFLAFFIFISAHPQWIVLLIPFLYLFALLNKSHYRLNLIWATIIDCLFFLCMSIKWFKVFWSGNELRGLDALITRPENGKLAGSLGGLIEKLGYSYVYPGVVAVLVALCIVFILQNYTEKIQLIQIKEEKFEQKFIITRVVIILFYILSLLLVSYI